MKKVFEFFDVTADIGVIARGVTLKDAFANSAAAMFSLITRLEDVRPSNRCRVTVAATDREGLLVAWLNELLYLFDAEHWLFSGFDIRRLTGGRLDAVCSGEKVDPTRHIMLTGVKAATYHQLRITRHRYGYTARVVFDI